MESKSQFALAKVTPFASSFPPSPPQHELQCRIAWITTTNEIGGSATGGRCRSTSRIPVGSIASASCHGNTRCKLNARSPRALLRPAQHCLAGVSDGVFPRRPCFRVSVLTSTLPAGSDELPESAIVLTCLDIHLVIACFPPWIP